MVDQTLTKPIGLIRDLKIHIHGILYVVTFIMMKNNVLKASNSMLLGCPLLWDVKVTHDWGNNLINIESNGTIHTITITKHLDSNTKCLKVLLCYNFVNIVTNEEKNMSLAVELDLFANGTIILPNLEVSAIVLVDWKINTNPKISIDAKMGTNVEIDTVPKIDIAMKINLDKPIFDFPHTLKEISIDTTLTHIEIQNMKMAKWNLLEEVQIHPLNLGTHNKLQVVFAKHQFGPFCNKCNRKNC